MSKSSFQPAIVVVAYQRPRCLDRLLTSIARADYSGYESITLIISIDRGDYPEVLQVAKNFNWEFGEKKIIQHSTNIGLKKHILFCGDLTKQYEAVIILEDDLFVSPGFYDYTCQALEYFQNLNYVSGISLYSYCYNEYARIRFIASDDGFDNYFLQSASSWGQSWTKYQWQEFRNWYDINSEILIAENEMLPEMVINWSSERSWKKHFIRYMVAENKYFVIPRISLTTNFAEVGDHMSSLTNNYQTSLILNKKTWNFSNLKQSKSIYDVYFEMTSACLKKNNLAFNNCDFECDLYGIKQINKIKTKYLLTIRDTSKIIASYDLKLIPHELNLIYELEGDFFNLIETDLHCSLSYRKKILQHMYINQNAGVVKYASLFFYGLVNRVFSYSKYKI
jgi:hypothetical protein